MFAPIAVDNIAFPQSSSLSTLDFIPESFEAWYAYSNIPTSSVYTTGSSGAYVPTNQLVRWGMGPNDRVMGINEAGGTVLIYDSNTRSLSTHGTQNIGTIRNVVWDNVTNSWVLCGANQFVKISCDNPAISSSISVPTNAGASQYPAAIAFGGKVYALPLVGTTSNTAVAIFDLVSNTATTSSVKVGTGFTAGFWGAVLNSVGTIYFFRESGATNTSIFEYNPLTTSGSAFGTMSGNIGYGATNLPNGNVFVPDLGTNQTVYIVNPVNKNIKTIPTAGFGYLTGICVGQNGHVYGVQSSTSGDNGIWGFNPKTEQGYLTQYDVRRPNDGGGRGFQDMFSLSDGRLLLTIGMGNDGRCVDYTYLANPNNNTFSSIGAVNPIITNAKAL